MLLKITDFSIYHVLIIYQFKSLFYDYMTSIPYNTTLARILQTGSHEKQQKHISIFLNTLHIIVYYNQTLYLTLIYWLAVTK